jgi:hypothetical protein
MEVLVCKSMLVKLAFIVLSVLYAGPLVLEADVHLTYIIYNLRIDSVHLVDVRESVAAEIYIRLRNVCWELLCKTEVLQISEEEDTLPLLSIAEREP